MYSQTIARPYALAAFNLAVDSKNEQSWNYLFQSSKALVNNQDNKILLDLINDPRIDEIVKYETFIALLAKVDKQVFNQDGESQKQFLRVLAENQRLFLIGRIADLFIELLAKHKGEYLLELESPYPIAKEVETLLTVKLEKVFGVKLIPTVKINHKIIGGFRAIVGSKVFDCSLATTLANTRKNLIF